MAASIVGGLIAALAVVTGVYLSQFLTRRQIREERLRELVATISSELTPIAFSLFGISEMEPTFAENFAQLTATIIEAETVVAGLGKRRVAKVDPHLRQLNYLLMAAAARRQAGTLTPDEHTAMIMPMRSLNMAVRPTSHQQEDFLDQTVHYIQNGLGAPPPDAAG